MDDRIEQIRRAWWSAKPTAQNPAWLNSHVDCGVLLQEIDKLREALNTILCMEVRGHQLQDRLQFSDEGRAILAKVSDALGTTSAAA